MKINRKLTGDNADFSHPDAFGWWLLAVVLTLFLVSIGAALIFNHLHGAR